MSDLSQPLSTSTSWPKYAIPRNWVESLFERMLMAYGSKFADQWRGVDPESLKRHWAEKLGTLTGEQLKTGVGKLDTLDWPPSLPQFIKLCKPSIDPTVAYYEAVAGVAARDKGEIGEWSSPAIFWAAAPMAFDLAQQTYSQIKGRWEKALQDQLDKGEWAPIPKPALQLAAPGNTKMDRQKAAKMLEEIGASGVLKKFGDHTVWYRRILRRVEEGDKTVTPIQIAFAQEAARNHGVGA